MSAYSDAVLADSPDVYYRLSQTGSGSGVFVDASGNGHHATPNATIVTATSLIATDADAAATFDWTTGFFSATTGYTLSQQPMTVEFWVKPIALTSNGSAAGHICACDGSAAGWGIKILDTSGIWRFTTAGVKDYQFAATAVAGVTQHMVFILTSAHDVDLYVNGAFSETVLHNVAMGATSDGLTIGMRGGAAPAQPRSVIDELAIYKSALSAARIAAHYAAATGRVTKNTRAWPLGMEVGMNWRGDI